MKLEDSNCSADDNQSDNSGQSTNDVAVMTERPWWLEETPADTISALEIANHASCPVCSRVPLRSQIYQVIKAIYLNIHSKFLIMNSVPKDICCVANVIKF